MIEFVLVLIVALFGDPDASAGAGADAGAGAGGNGAPQQAAAAPPSSGTAKAPAAAAGPADQDRARQSYAAEPQDPTGRFTTAVEVRPILAMTRNNWVAVRDWDGRDLLYVTHILGWRCGLVALHVGINGAPAEAWPLPPCLEDTNAPNAITDDAVIYKSYPAGSIESVLVEITYDDLSTDRAEFERKTIQMP